MMTKSEINEIRRRMNIEKNAITCIRGCYVNEKKDIVATFNRALQSFPQEEGEKYLGFFRRVLSGAQGKNLIPIEFRPDQLMDSGQHALLSGMRNTQLKVDEGFFSFCQSVIDTVDLEGNYLILMLHEAFDVPFKVHGGDAGDADSEEVFSYILCAICPVKLTKPALGYFAEDNDFHERLQEWIVASPELGFLFPAYEDCAANLSEALYYTRDADNLHPDFMDAIFDANKPVPAAEQKEAFDAMLEEALGHELSLEVVQTIHEGLSEVIAESKADKDAPTASVSKREICKMLTDSGVGEESVKGFEKRFDEEFGLAMNIEAANIVDEKKFEVRTPNVIIKADPEYAQNIQTRMIDGAKYILIPADDGVMVNGLNISIRD